MFLSSSTLIDGSIVTKTITIFLSVVTSLLNYINRISTQKSIMSIQNSSSNKTQFGFDQIFCANPSWYAAIDAIKTTFMDTQEILKSALDDISRQVIVQWYKQSKFLSIQQPQAENICVKRQQAWF